MKRGLSWLGCILISSVLWGQASKPQVNLKKSAEFAAQTEALIAMPAKERMAKLKSMAPSERRGLWYQVKRELQLRKNGSLKDGFYQNPANRKPVSVGGNVWQGTPRATGTIVYDADFPSVGFGGGSLVGNRFNTHTGVPVFGNGTVETIQAQVVPAAANTTSSAGFVLLGPQTTMGGAMAIFSTFTVAAGVIDSLNFPGLGVGYTGSSFYVLFGDFASVYIPVLGTASTNGQGHHGVVGYTGGIGPNITATGNVGGGLNAFIRATGNIVPVELMKVEVQ